MSSVCSPPRSTPNLIVPSWAKALLRPAEHAWSSVLVLTAVCGILFFYGLSVGELWRTESLRAIIAAEFLRSGNWIVPTLYGEPLFTKPPGMYAAIALASWPFGGVSEWTARLPSAVAASATVFLVYWYFGRQLGRQGGLVAALVLPLSPMWLEKGTTAEIDMLQVAWTTAAILFFLRALEVAEENKGWFWWLAALLCVAGGVLTKWTSPAFFYGTAIPLLWWRGRLRLLVGRKHLVSAALGAGVCLAWAGAAVTLEGWDVLASTVGREAMQRLVPQYSPRPYPWAGTFLHPLRLLAAALPWSAVALLTLRPGFAQLWDERGRRLLQALHCWAWPNMLLWSLPTEHTPRHSFPLFPGIAGLAAMVLLAWLTGRLPWRIPRLRPKQVLVGALVLWLALKVVFVHAVVARRHGVYAPRATGQLLASLVPPGSVLYVLRLKDEGIMFYYGRPVLRVAAPTELPSTAEPTYCILTVAEWEQWGTTRPTEVVRSLYDEQGGPCVLVRVTG